MNEGSIKTRPMVSYVEENTTKPVDALSGVLTKDRKFYQACLRNRPYEYLIIALRRCKRISWYGKYINVWTH